MHDVNNVYRQFSGGSSTVNTVRGLFLDELNNLGSFSGLTPTEALNDDPNTCFAFRCNWRLPSIQELRSIMVGSDAPSGQAQTCSSAPCVDPELAAVDGAMDSDFYWSRSENSDNPRNYFFVGFNGGFVSFADGDILADFTYNEFRVRAVTTGGCP